MFVAFHYALILTQDLKLSHRINVLKSSRAIRPVNVEQENQCFRDLFGRRQQRRC
jgi:hypothetical protein